MTNISPEVSDAICRAQEIYERLEASKPYPRIDWNKCQNPFLVERVYGRAYGALHMIKSCLPHDLRWQSADPRINALLLKDQTLVALSMALLAHERVGLFVCGLSRGTDELFSFRYTVKHQPVPNEMTFKCTLGCEEATVDDASVVYLGRVMTLRRTAFKLKDPKLDSFQRKELERDLQLWRTAVDQADQVILRLGQNSNNGED